MFELLRILIEQISRHIDFSAIRRMRKENRLADVGIDLFTLYLATNRIYVTGQEILREVKQFRDYFDKWKSYGVPQSRVETRLKEKVEEQCMNIREFHASFRRLAKVSAIIDPKFAVTAGLIAQEKEGTIFDVLVAVFSDKSRVLSSSTERKLIQLMSKAIEPRTERVEPRFERRWRMMYDSDETDTIRDVGLFDEEHLSLVERYIVDMKPETQLESLGKTLDEFHVALSKNFKVKDILLRVGERRDFA